MKVKSLFSILAAVTIFISQETDACTGISIQAKDKAIIQARTIEWATFKLNSKLVISPRGEVFQSRMPTGKYGITWKAKYGFVGISVESDGFIGEGVNEKGLNTGIFFFKNYGLLAPYREDSLDKKLNDMDFTKWMLSQFSTVEEVKAAINKITLVPVIIENGEPSPTGHWRVTDANGGSIVIEVVNGGVVQVFDNNVGVLTNSPGFDWMTTNLNSYVNLRPGDAKPFEMDKLKIFAFGSGSGFLGMPGDITPPSRFVRAAFYLYSMPTPDNAFDGVTEAFHILNNFDLPIGIEFPEKDMVPKNLPSATQWTAVCDLTNKVYYYHTMYNNTIRMVDLKKIDFDKVSLTILPLDNPEKQPISEINIPTK